MAGRSGARAAAIAAGPACSPGSPASASTARSSCCWSSEPRGARAGQGRSGASELSRRASSRACSAALSASGSARRRRRRWIAMPPAPITSSSAGPNHRAPGRGLDRRLEQHEIAVARGQEVDDLLVAVARDQPLAHQPAQVVGEVGVGIVDRLVLADQAAELLRERPRALLERRVGQHLVRAGRGPDLRREQRREQQQEREPAPHPFSFASIGSSVWSTSCGIRGPTNLCRMRPSASITKVSGTP